MRKLLSIAVVLALGYFVVERWSAADHAPESAASADSSIADAYQSHRSGIEVQGRGNVVRVLADDLDGDRHQRFILRLDGGQTLLIAHNIDLAPRLPGLKVGDVVEFHGEYAWNAQGGVVHWTHKDPRARHQPGWLRYEGRTYQ